MVLYSCAGCGVRPREKLAQLYWAWFREDGVRTAWKQRLCVDCTSSRVGSILAHSQGESSDLTMCPSCGADASSDLDPIYLTIYVPRRERRDFSLRMCAACAAVTRAAAQQNADKLVDRQSSSAETSPTSAWDRLGLSPQT